MNKRIEINLQFGNINCYRADVDLVPSCERAEIDTLAETTVRESFKTLDDLLTLIVIDHAGLPISSNLYEYIYIYDNVSDRVKCNTLTHLCCRFKYQNNHYKVKHYTLINYSDHWELYFTW